MLLNVCFRVGDIVSFRRARRPSMNMLRRTITGLIPISHLSPTSLSTGFKESPFPNASTLQNVQLLNLAYADVSRSNRMERGQLLYQLDAKLFWCVYCFLVQAKTIGADLSLDGSHSHLAIL